MATKKGVGDVMNQLAIISDLLENINLDTKEIKVDIELEGDDFDELHNRVVQKRGFLSIPKKNFKIVVSGIEFIFRKS